MSTKIAVIGIEEIIAPQKMIKRGVKEDISNFLQNRKKLHVKRRRQVNTIKWKACLEETSSRKSTICSSNNSDKKESLVFRSAIIKSEASDKDMNRAVICIDAYYTACFWKKA